MKHRTEEEKRLRIAVLKYGGLPMKQLENMDYQNSVLLRNITYRIRWSDGDETEKKFKDDDEVLSYFKRLKNERVIKIVSIFNVEEEKFLELGN